MTSAVLPEEEKTPKRKSLSRSKAQTGTTPKTDSPGKQTVSLSKQTSASVLINMTGNQSKVTDSVSDMEVDSISLTKTGVSEKTGSSERLARKPLATDILKRSPVMTRKRSLSRTRKEEPVSTEMTDVKPSVEELSQSITAAKVVDDKQKELDLKKSKIDTEIPKQLNVNDTGSKQISSTKSASAPKGLRPTIKLNQKKPISKTDTTVPVKTVTTVSAKPGLSNQTGIAVHCDPVQDEKSKVNESLKKISRTNLSSNKLLSQTGKSESSSLLKSGTLISGSKLLGDLDQSQTRTRSQTKQLDTAQTKVCIKYIALRLQFDL